MAKLISTIYLYLFIAVTLSISNQVFALKSDRNQPTRLSSNKADFDDVSQEYVLQGKAKITKGSLVVEGEKATIVVDPEGFQLITVIAPANMPAKFSQLMDGPEGDRIEGEGDVIFYDAKAETLLIKGKASARKRQGIYWRDKLNAEEINYDLATEKYDAVSTASSKPVKSILSPRIKESNKLALPK